MVVRGVLDFCVRGYCGDVWRVVCGMGTLHTKQDFTPAEAVEFRTARMESQVSETYFIRSW